MVRWRTNLLAGMLPSCTPSSESNRYDIPYDFHFTRMRHMYRTRNSVVLQMQPTVPCHLQPSHDFGLRLTSWQWRVRVIGEWMTPGARVGGALASVFKQQIVRARATSPEWPGVSICVCARACRLQAAEVTADSSVWPPALHVFHEGRAWNGKPFTSDPKRGRPK